MFFPNLLEMKIVSGFCDKKSLKYLNHCVFCQQVLSLYYESKHSIYRRCLVYLIFVYHYLLKSLRIHSLFRLYFIMLLIVALVFFTSLLYFYLNCNTFISLFVYSVYDFIICHQICFMYGLFRRVL